MRMSLKPLTLSTALAIGAAALAGCGASAGEADGKAAADAKKEVPAVPVEVAQVESGVLEPVYAATATLEAEREATIRAEMPGEILAVLVEEGDRVVKGQPLARLDAERSSLQVKQASTLVERMTSETARAEKLLGRQMISREAYDRMRYERDTQRAVVDIAAHSVDKSVVRAPYDGVITRRHVKQGQWLVAQAPTFDIADFSELTARLDVPERQAELLKAGQPVKLVADALAGKAYSGTVERLAPVVDRASGTVGVTLAVDNAESMLRPGLFVRVAVSYERIADATLLPKQAVVAAPDRQHVFVVAAGVAKQRVVSLGLENGNHVQVLEGVEPGATVVTVGQSGLKDGDKVQVVNLDADAAVAANLR